MMGAVDIIPAKHILCLVAQILAGRVTVTDVPVPLVLLVGTVNSLIRIVAATYSTFQGRDNVNAALSSKKRLYQ